MNKIERLILESCELILQVNVGNQPDVLQRDRAFKLKNKINDLLSPKIETNVCDMDESNTTGLRDK